MFEFDECINITFERLVRSSVPNKCKKLSSKFIYSKFSHKKSVIIYSFKILGFQKIFIYKNIYLQKPMNI